MPNRSPHGPSAGTQMSYLGATMSDPGGRPETALLGTAGPRRDHRAKRVFLIEMLKGRFCKEPIELWI